MITYMLQNDIVNDGKFIGSKDFLQSANAVGPGLKTKMKKIYSFSFSKRTVFAINLTNSRLSSYSAGTLFFSK